MNFLSNYNTIFFDCDGVILDSNKIKTNAFYQTVKIYGDKVAHEMVDYHVKNGGISRYNKFEYLFTNILKRDIVPSELNYLLNAFSKEIKQGLLACPMAEGIEELRIKTQDTIWFVVSGGDQAELREVFKIRGMDILFNGGIFGSPDTKNIILEREIKSLNTKVLYN